MARRRRMTGQPLLLASAGAVLVMGCHKQAPEQPVGNLMASPSITTELCVDAEPLGAVVTVDGREVGERCTTVEVGSVHIEVAADGFEPQMLDVDATVGMPPVVVALMPGGDPSLEPVGNLMSPPEHR